MADREQIDSIVFYRSFFEAVEDLEDPETKLQAYQAIFRYGLDGEETELRGAAKAIFRLVRPQIDANYEKRVNGRKGGRPPQSQAKTKEKPKHNQSITKAEPNVNVNGNVNVNDNDNVNVNGENEHSTTAKPYGKFKNVFLEDYQFEDLKAEFPEIKKVIEKMSAYLAENKKTYNNFYANLRLWALRDGSDKPKDPKKPEPVASYDIPVIRV